MKFSSGRKTAFLARTPWAGLALAGLLYLAGVVSGAELPRLSVRVKNIVNLKGEPVSLRGINFGGWLMMESWIPSLEMEWHYHLPRLAREVGIEGELKAAEKEAGGFDDDKERIHDYIARVHQKLQPRISEEKFKAYLDWFVREPSVFAAKDMDAQTQTARQLASC